MSKISIHLYEIDVAENNGVTKDFGSVVKIMLFLRMRKEKMLKRLNCLPFVKIFDSYRKSGSVNRESNGVVEI